MESIGQTLSRQGHVKADIKELKEAILSDPEVSAFILEHKLSQHEITISLTKFNQFIRERERFLSGDQHYVAKGYKPILVMNDGYADVSYKETKELLEQQKAIEIASRIELINLPKTYRTIRFEDIALDDENRLAIFEWLTNFISNYPNVDKGAYIYGDMGIGKSFILAALARELSELKEASTMFLHYPSFTIDIKNAISGGSVKEEIDRVKRAEVLILDDIGAEQSSSWLRDDVLQTILQYRMLEDLPTFFTSNYSMNELMEHFAEVKSSGQYQRKEETWQAKRVMERIQYLATEFHLEGINRR